MVRYFYVILALFISMNAWSDSLNVPKGAKQFTVTLDANPTTGFQWTVIDYDASLLAVEKSEYLPGNKQLIGSGGQMAFVFKVKLLKALPKKTQIVFRYARTWEKGTAVDRTVEVYFKK